MSFESLAQLITHRALHDSEQIFLSSPEQGIDVTYNLFYQNAKKLAWYMQKQGLQQGQRVILLLDNGLGWAIAFWGILLAGGVAVPLNPHFKTEEINGLLQQAEGQFIIADDERIRILASGWLAGSRTNGYALDIGGNQELFIIEACPQKPSAKRIEEIDLQPYDEALLLFTSGSTGVPKGVVLTHGNLLAEANFIQQGHKLTSDDIVLSILPFFHINGLVITLITPAFSGGRAIVPQKFSASRFWNLVNQYQVTWFSAVPTILSILLSKGKNEELLTASLRFARSASSSLSVAILEQFEKTFQVPVIEAYGMSEAGSQITTNPLPPATRKAGSVGLPVGNEVRVVDQNGDIADRGVVGEVVLKGANVTHGYLNNPKANQDSFKNGWFYTGDLGFFDEDGYLFLTGRRKELINRGGEKISPREVDEVLYQLSEIETAAAVGVPDRLFGEEVVAFIKLRPGTQLSTEKVLGHCKNCLADFKVPKEILYLEDFPKGPNGKIQRRSLIELYSRLT
jgi:acyl-CoA synthetase (AMP-forming)/AMP-acid ligase II